MGADARRVLPGDMGRDRFQILGPPRSAHRRAPNAQRRQARRHLEAQTSKMDASLREEVSLRSSPVGLRAELGSAELALRQEGQRGHNDPRKLPSARMPREDSPIRGFRMDRPRSGAHGGPPSGAVGGTARLKPVTEKGDCLGISRRDFGGTRAWRSAARPVRFDLRRMPVRNHERRRDCAGAFCLRNDLIARRWIMTTRATLHRRSQSRRCCPPDRRFRWCSRTCLPDRQGRHRRGQCRGQCSAG